MATIGGVTCDILRGVPAKLKERVEVWQLPGITGYGALRTGQGESGTELLAVRFGSNATVNSWWNSINALHGTVVTIVDDFGDSYTSMLIQHVSNLAKSPAAWAAGAATDKRGELRIQAVKTN